jgi:RNA polymerase sigma-70 factor (ECF subfamily)
LPLQTLELYVAPALATTFAHTVQWPAHRTNTMSESVPRNARNDAELLAAMASGDEAAATALYDRHSATLMAVAFRLIRERADAESVVLESFTQAWRDAARFDASRGSVISWLLTIARTRSLDLLRSSARAARRAGGDLDEVPSEILTAPASAGDPGYDFDHGERQRAVAAALGQIPDNQSSAYEHAFFDGLSHSEIAERLSEPLGTIKTRIRLGMLKLRDALGAFREVAS